MRAAHLCPVLVALLVPTLALADAQPDRFSAGGYFRIMTRPDLQGGDGKLGFYNLYGRLLNEGPYAALELKLDVLQLKPQSSDVWASVHTKIEGGSIGNADPANGSLAQYRLSQLYVKAGNILFDRVTWQLGTLESYFGMLGLYDFRGGQVFHDTVGLSGRYSHDRFELLLGVGDAGFATRGFQYSTILTGGGQAKLRLGSHVEVGVGGQYLFEPRVVGNRFAPYATPGLDYENFHRREVVQRYLEENPGQEDLFPKPVPTSSRSFRTHAYLGFGQLGPIEWNSLFIEFNRQHPDNFYTERFGGREYTIYITQLTDERFWFSVGNELMLKLVPNRLDAVLAVFYADTLNRDNAIAPGEDNRTVYSAVLRLQLYLTRTVHWLGETSLAQERSKLGNVYREHSDSLFRNTRGVADTRGLEFGDTDTRNTWQLKTGFVLNPTGFGIYTRPSLRLLYGLQYSNQQNAFGNGFVESLDQYNVFVAPENHWHSVVAIEAEGWF